MKPVLVVTPYTDSFEEIEEAVSGLEAKCFRATDIANSRTALSADKFAAVFVDATLGRDAVDALLLAWKYDPLLIGGIFKLGGVVAEPWEAKFYGARIYDGSTALEQLRETIVSLQYQPGGYPVTEKQVLLIEDLDAPRFIISRYIHAMGYSEPIAVSSGKEALLELQKDPDRFFCIVSDLKMPEMSGVEFIRTVRADAKLKHLPIIVLTAVPTPQNLLDCVREGATGFLVKPPLKRLLRIELEKAQRIFTARLSPRLCKPEEAQLLEGALRRLVLTSA